MRSLAGLLVVRPRSWRNLAADSGADLEAGEPLDGDAGLVEDRLDRLLGVGHRRLLEQDDVLEEAVEATLDDLRRSPARACPPRGRSPRRSRAPCDTTSAGTSSRVRYCGASRRSASRRRGRPRVVTVVLDEYADGGRQVGRTLVQVGHDRPVEVRDPAELDLLADGDRQALDDLADGLAVAASTALSASTSAALASCGGVRDLLRRGDELLVLRDEVGLAVELDERAAGGARPGRTWPRARRRAWRPWPRP